ncbi:MAG TPA: hypothetical protein VIM14_05995, partial [Polyangia bacterium]
IRVEALLGLDRKAEALAALDGLPLASMPNRNERLVLQGELRAAAGRWHEAWADFDKLLSTLVFGIDSKSRNVVERALWGRAPARSRLGDDAGARADLAMYLRDFPSGQFAIQAWGVVGSLIRARGNGYSQDESTSGLNAGLDAEARVGTRLRAFRIWADVVLCRWLGKEIVRVDPVASGSPSVSTLPGWDVHLGLGASVTFD